MKRTTKKRLRDLTLYGVLALVVLFIALLADWKAVQENFFDKSVFKGLFPELVTEAAKNTIVYTAIAFSGGLALALVLALMKMSPLAGYRWIATVYIEFFRGLPALIVILGFALAVPLAFQWRPPGGTIGAAILGLIVVSAAYMAETLRAGLESVPKGQTEAAQSLGMGATWTLISVTLPQAVRTVLPPLTNEFVLLLKDTSLIQFVGVGLGERELTGFASNTLQQSGNATPLMAVALSYLIITLPLTRVVAGMERKSKRAR